MSSSKLSLTLLLFTLEILFATSSAIETPCGNWEPFKNERCFKVFESVGLEIFENAEKTCQQSGASLIRIHYPEEQAFLTNFLFNKSAAIDNVWIGAKFGASKFNWDDNSELTFTNWAQGHPKNLPGYCVQMHSDQDSLGKWVDENCLKKYLVACQKKPNLGIERMEEILLQVKQSLADTQKELAEAKIEMKKNLETAIQTSVPIGFIYAQLPKEKIPSEIWPSMKWTDVSATYAGVFFRILGGETSSFGEIQNENSPRLTKIGTQPGRDFCCRDADIPTGSWSSNIFTGVNGDASHDFSLKFFVSGGEIRPRNMAIRIWKRTG